MDKAYRSIPGVCLSKHGYADETQDRYAGVRKITAVAVQSSTAAHAWQQPKRIPEITVFTTAGTIDVNIACCITNVYHFSSFHDIKF